MNHLHNLDHEYHVFLDNRLGERGQLSVEDSEKRLKACLALAKDCDLIIVPPVYEILILQSDDSEYKKYNQKVASLFSSLIQNHILPYSIVGKIGLIGPRHHQDLFQNHWNTLKSDYTPTDHQANNKHFQTQFPLYPIATDHWNILYTLDKSWFVNKLIKDDLAKFKDYNIDTVLALDRGYLKHGKVIKQKFHNKIRRYDEKIIFGILDTLLNSSWATESKYSVEVNYTGDDYFMNNKVFERTLARGKSTEVRLQKIETLI